LPSESKYRKPFPDFCRRIPGRVSDTYRNPASFAESTGSVAMSGNLCFFRAPLISLLDAGHLPRGQQTIEVWALGKQEMNRQ
jgi:hypothetical protein